MYKSLYRRVSKKVLLKKTVDRIIYSANSVIIQSKVFLSRLKLPFPSPPNTCHAGYIKGQTDEENEAGDNENSEENLWW